ncbi:hypothetical protein Tco_0451055 [Tanacetum coccineum]
MTELVSEEYITITRKNYISGNDGGKIVEKSFLELKGKFLMILSNNAFSETNREDVVEYIEIFSSEWFKEECIGWVTTWEDLTEKFFGKIYPPSRTNSKMKADERMKSDDDVTNNEEPCDDREKDPDEENENAKIFRIETDLFEDDGYCNGGNLPGRFRVGNTIQYQDYEWYEALEDSDLKDESLRNKVALEESMNQEKESSSNY